MSTKIQFKRGTTAQVDAITPDSGEPLWETDGLLLAIGDGSTAGGKHVVMADGGGFAGGSNLAWTTTAATAGEYGLKITTTDSVAQTAGYIQSFLVDHNITGAKSGTAQNESISVDMDIGANVVYTYPIAVYVSQSVNPNITFLAGAQIYLEDMGSGTIGGIAGLDIQIGSTNLGSRHTGVRLVSHTGTARSGILFEKAWTIGIDLSGTASGGMAASMATADIKFHHGTTLLDDGTDLTLAGAVLVVPAAGLKVGTSLVTLAGALTTSGAYALTLTTTAATSVTLPTTGTLATLAGTESLTNKTLGGALACGGQQLNNAQYIELDEITTPSALADHGKLYTKTDNKPYFQDGAGTEKSIPSGEGVRAYHDAVQAVAHNTWTTLALNSENYDTDSIHDNVTNNERLTCKTAGKYLITASVSWESHATGARYVLLALNGTTIVYLVDPAGAAGDWTQNVITVYDLAVDDYLILRVKQISTAELEIAATAYSPIFMIQRVG